MSRNVSIEEAKDKGYLLSGRGKADHLNEKYYTWCKISNKPFVKVAASNKYAIISIDLITTTFDLNETGQHEIGLLFRQHSLKPNSVGVSHGYCSVDKVLNEDVDAVISELMPIYEEFKVERKILS